MKEEGEKDDKNYSAVKRLFDQGNTVYGIGEINGGKAKC